MKKTLCFAATLCALIGLVPVANAAALSRAERKQISKVVDIFVVHGVRRQHPEVAYEVVSPALRAGMTRAQWARSSNLPIYPYPARGRHFPWILDYKEPREVGATLLLHPMKKARKMVSIAFDLRLVKVRGEWRVESLIPAATFAPPEGPSKVQALPDFAPQPQSAGGTREQSRVGHLYAIIPFTLLGTLAAALTAWGLVRWYRDRRLMLAQPRSLPPLNLRRDGARARPGHQA